MIALARMQRNQNSRPLGVECKTWLLFEIQSGIPLVKHSVPTIPLLRIYPREMKTYSYIHTRVCAQIAAIFYDSQKWKQFTHLSINEGLNKMRSIHTVQYY